MDKHIIDGMKKEGNIILILTIAAFALVSIEPLISLINGEKPIYKDLIIILVLCIVIISPGLYGWLYSLKYKLEITEEKVSLKTLFRKVEVDIKDVTNYSCKRFGKTEFYQFYLFTKDKRVLINTRYKEEFEKILKDNNVELKPDEKITETKKKNIKIIKIIGHILFWLTLISPFASLFLVDLIGESDIFGIAGIIRYSWIMWLFLPIGIFSILIGRKLMQYNQKYRKNYIIAYICLPILFLTGLFRFTADDVTYNVNKVKDIEKITNLDLPNKVKIATSKIESYNVSYLKITNDEEKENFEYELKTNSIWEENLNSDIKNLLPLYFQSELQNFDYFVLYNVTNNEYNVHPTNGEYECIFISYDCELKRIFILDSYKINLK